jgi:hypothetical protein
LDTLIKRALRSSRRAKCNITVKLFDSFQREGGWRMGQEKGAGSLDLVGDREVEVVEGAGARVVGFRCVMGLEVMHLPGGNLIVAKVN